MLSCTVMFPASAVDIQAGNVRTQVTSNGEVRISTPQVKVSTNGNPRLMNRPGSWWRYRYPGKTRARLPQGIQKQRSHCNQNSHTYQKTRTGNSGQNRVQTYSSTFTRVCQ
ncbi:MAG: hypothetical protein VKJ46_05265 [Leptolyngbyaceae bacterium]|nr:hypothetical protein [Leptolyngbyaceae bacterium]